MHPGSEGGVFVNLTMEATLASQEMGATLATQDLGATSIILQLSCALDLDEKIVGELGEVSHRVVPLHVRQHPATRRGLRVEG